MSYRIATFNIQKFSRLSVSMGKDGNRRKDLEMISRIVRENKIDILAIQEVFNKEALKELLEAIAGQYAEDDRLKRGSKDYGSNNINSRMNDSYGYRTKHWEGRWAKPKSNYGDNIAEGYAFIWNRDRIKLVTNMKNEVFEPRIADFGDVNSIVRPPFLGRFMPINGRFEIRLINTHIVYSTPSKKIDEDEDIEAEVSLAGEDDIMLRKNEFKSIINTIFVDYSEMVFDKTRHDKEARQLVPYTFVLGDYNLNLNSSNTTSRAKFDKEDECIRISSKGELEIVTVNDQLTTLKGKKNNPELQAILDADPVNEHHLVNNYDHFSYDSNRVFEKYIGSPKVIMAVDYYENNNNETKYEIYKSKISDHLPVYIDLDLSRQ